VLAGAGLEPVVRVENPTPVGEPRLNTEIRRYEDGAARYVLVYPQDMGARTRAARIRNRATIRLPEAGHVYDLRAGRYLGRTDRAEVLLVEAEPVILSVLPAKMEKVEATTDARNYRPGDEVALRMAARPARPAFRRVFHVEATNPDGTLMPAYTMRVDTPRGRAKAVVPLPLNAAPGTWLLNVRDTATGLAAGVRFEVQDDAE
jgi:hypothetical protein